MDPASPSARHGVATLIREDICYTSYGCASTDLFTWHTLIIRDRVLVNIYRPPSAPANDFSTLPLHPHLPTYFIGDFNSPHVSWGYRTNSPSGCNLVQWITDNGLRALYTPGTYSFTSAIWRSSTHPDLVVIPENDHITSYSVLGGFPRSQHKPLLVSLDLEFKPLRTTMLPRWNFRKARWDVFEGHFQGSLLSPPDVGNLSEQWSLFSRSIYNCALLSIPRGARKPYIPCWSDAAATLYRDYQCEPDWQRKCEIGDELLSRLNSDRHARWIESMEKMDFTHSARKAYTLLRRLNARNVQKISVPLSPDAFATQVKHASKLTIDRTDKKKILNMKKEIQKFLKEDHIVQVLRESISTSEVTAAIRMTKIGKQPGCDNICPEFFHHLGANGIAWLTSFFNCCFSSCKIPKQWRKSIIIPVLKPGKDPFNPSSYRPISLLCVGYKIYERILLNRLIPYVEATLPRQQYGFRPGRSTELQTLLMTQSIENGFEERKKCGALFVDLTSAYDTVWLLALSYKLSKIIPDSFMVSVLRDLLSNRSFVVKIGQRSSRLRSLRNGLPQGSVLAPTLFNCYIFDIPKCTSDVPKCTAEMFLYADDAAFLMSGRQRQDIESGLQTLANQVSVYYKKWGLTINPSKCQTVLFQLGPKLPDLTICMNNVAIPSGDSFCYLGVHLDRSLTYNRQCTQLSQKLQKRVNLLRLLAGSDWGASPHSLRTTTTVMIQSVAEYACSVWGRSAHRNKIDQRMFEAMRIISALPTYTKNSLLPPVCNLIHPESRRIQLIGKRYTACAQSSDPRLRSLVHPDHLPHQRLKSRHSFSASFLCPNPATDSSHAVPPPWGISLTDAAGLNRRAWKNLNRLRCNATQSNWRDIVCRCGLMRPKADHIVSCPRIGFPDGIVQLQRLGAPALRWLHDISDVLPI